MKKSLLLLLTPAALAQTTLGPTTAPVSIVMYADLECPFSASTVPAVERLIRRHPDQIRLDLRPFPLDQHPKAPLAHEATLAAAAQGKYLEMVNLIQANQQQMDRAQYLRYAALLHLDLKRFTHDLDTHRFAPEIQNDLATGKALGIDVTPTIFLNGQRLNGEQTQPTLELNLQKALSATQIASAPTPVRNLAPEDLTALAKDPVASTGPLDAPVTIVEFTDFQCPYCRRASEPMHQLMAQSGQNVRWVYRSYPLDFHAHAEPAAEAALAAAAQGQFWPMHDLLFANQDKLDREHFDLFARQLKLDMARFDSDLDTGVYKAQIAADRAMGAKYGVDGTPAFFINGAGISGVRTLAEMQQAVQLALTGSPTPLRGVPFPLGTPSSPGAPSLSLSSKGGVTNPPSSTAPLLSSFAEGGGPASRLVPTSRHFIPATSPAPSPTPVDWYLDIETAAGPAIGSAIEQLPATTQVAIHSYTLPNHPNAALAYRALTVAAQFPTPTAFWTLYNTLAGQPLPEAEAAARAYILKAATAAGLPSAAITAAFDDPQLAADLTLDKQTAYQRGIRGVPVVFIANQRIDGVQPPATYEKALTTAQPQTIATR